MDRISFKRRSRRISAHAPVTGKTAPPENWRMPAAATTNITGASAALNAAQATSTSKTRPSVTVADGETKYIEWAVAEAGTLLYTQIANFRDHLTSELTLNGVDQGMTIRGEAERMRQGKALAVEAGDLVRITWTASGASRTLSPLLHKIPATGPWDAWLVIGASRESSHYSTLYEAEVIAEFPTRDPVIFNAAVGGYALGSQALIDLPPSEWSKIDDILDDEGDYECRARSIARKRLSASCVKRRFCWRRAPRPRRRAVGSRSANRPIIGGARNMAV